MSDAALARSAGLDAQAVADDVRLGRYQERMREDFVRGVRSGLNGTPTCFIGATRYDGSWDEEGLVNAVEAAARR